MKNCNSEQLFRILSDKKLKVGDEVITTCDIWENSRKKKDSHVIPKGTVLIINEVLDYDDEYPYGAHYPDGSDTPYYYKQTEVTLHGKSKDESET